MVSLLQVQEVERTVRKLRWRGYRVAAPPYARPRDDDDHPPVIGASPKAYMRSLFGRTICVSYHHVTDCRTNAELAMTSLYGPFLIWKRARR